MAQEIIDFLKEGIVKSDNVFILSSVSKNSNLQEMVSEYLIKLCSRWSVSDFKSSTEEFISTTPLKPCQIMSTINSVTIFMISKRLLVDELKEWTKSNNYILRALSTCLFIKYYMEGTETKEDNKNLTELYEHLITLETNDQVRLFSIQALSSLDSIIHWRFELFEILVNYLDLYKELDSGDGHIVIKTIKFFLSRVGLVLGTQMEDNSDFIDQASEEKTPFELLLKISSVELQHKSKQSLACLVSLSLGIFNGHQLLSTERKQELSTHLMKNLEYHLPTMNDKMQRATYFMSICCYLTDHDQEQYYINNIDRITSVGQEALDKNDVNFLLRQNKVVGLFIRDNVSKIVDYLNRYISVHGGGDDGVDEEEGEISTEFLMMFNSILINTTSKLFIESFYPILIEYLNTWKEEYLTLDETPELFEIYLTLSNKKEGHTNDEVESNKKKCIQLLNLHERAISNEIIYCLESGDLDDILLPMEFYLSLMINFPEECKQLYMNSIENHLTAYFVILFEDFNKGNGCGLYNDYQPNQQKSIDALFDKFLDIKSQTCPTKELKFSFFKSFTTGIESKYCPLFKKYFELS